MELLDEDGRLFGVVNVIDALVVLLLVAVLVAGVALVDPFGGGEGATRYATVEFDRQPGFVADQVSVGDRMAAGPQGGNVTVTDVYVTPGRDEANATVVARLQVSGELAEVEGQPGRAFTYGGERLPAGSGFTLDTGAYTMRGRLTAISPANETLPTSVTPVRIETTVASTTAEAVETGDQYRLAGRTLAAITDVESYPVGDPNRRFLSIGVELRTITQGGNERFAGRQVTLGSTLPFRTGEYNVTGRVVQRGSTELPGRAETTTIEVEVEGVKPAVADQLRPGVTESIRGRTTATVTAVSRENATVVLRSEGGDIFAREHPVNEDVDLTLELATRRTNNTLRFHGDQLAVGRGVTLEFGTVRVNGTVTRLGQP
jgi:hypothetical protein